MTEETILGTQQSKQQARRILDEIAQQGHWKAQAQGTESVIYRKGNNEITVRKKADRQWQVVKYTVEETKE